MKYAAGLLLVGLMLFLPAGTLRYACAWLFMALLFIPILLMGIVLLRKAPDLLYPILMVLRIRNEESVLEKGLPGYTEYKQRVKYRLIPFIWKKQSARRFLGTSVRFCAFWCGTLRIF